MKKQENLTAPEIGGIVMRPPPPLRKTRRELRRSRRVPSAAAMRQEQLMAQWWAWIELQRERRDPMGDLARDLIEDRTTNNWQPRSLATIIKRVGGDYRDGAYTTLEDAVVEFNQYRWWTWLEQQQTRKPTDEISDLALDLRFRGGGKPLSGTRDLDCYLELCGMSIPWITRTQLALRRARAEFRKTGELR